SPTANHIYYKKRSASGWDAEPTDWINESTDGLTYVGAWENTARISSYYKEYGGNIGIVYMTKNSSPYNIRQAVLGGSPSTIGTTTDSNFIFPHMRKSFYANGRYWVFYSNGTDGVYRTLPAGPDWVKGKYGTALEFDGLNDYVKTSTWSGFPQSGEPVTYEAWVYLKEYKSEWGGNVLVGFPWADDTGILIHNGYPRFGVFASEDDKLHTYQYSTQLNLDTWYHIVGIYENHNVHLYVNGIGEHWYDIGYTPRGSGYDYIMIGATSASYYYLNGIIDDVRIYNYARTADEIRLDYNAGMAARFGPLTSCDEDPGACITYGLVGYWSFDEGTGTIAYDSTNNNNDGTIYGATWVEGRFGSALSFDGNDYVDVGDVGVSEGNAFTIEAWFRSSAGKSCPTIYSEGTPANWPTNLIILYGPETDDHVRVWHRDGSGTGGTLLEGGTSLNDNAWHHVAYVQRALNDRELYVDGLSVDTDSTSLSALSVTNAYIGANNNNGSMTQFSDDVIDEVRIYNRALSATEIRYHYNRGGPVAYWKFNEGSGDIVYDSANNNDGTLAFGDYETADSGTTESVVKETTNYRLNYSNDYYNGWIFEATSGAAQGLTTTVSDYVVINAQNDKEIYLTDALPGFAAGDSYHIYKNNNKPIWTSGKYGGALQFDGEDDYINLGFSAPDLSEISGNQLTIGAWIYPQKVSGNQYIITKNGPFMVYLSGNKLSANIYTSSWQGVTGNISILANQWTYIAVVYDGSKISLFVNGRFDNSVAQSGNLAGNGYVQIGRYNNGSAYGGPGAYFQGLIDEVRVYNYARSPEQILQDYNQGSAVRFGD
ncbi:MAG: LamG domain-containing protein, partial [Bacteroidales bacterium]|nr:LamG domain-containing protein [Bacteroidales bacterium]